ncbi:ATP-binding protein, partial [Citrobacter freundii]|uniref:ATP-binding protein n=1 Tax=Citrobacter freundii TaxID=546 RepID=UPI00350F5AA6
PGKSFFSAHEVSTCKISGCLSYRILDSGPDGTQTTLTSNLLSNAIKYSPDNTCTAIHLERDSDCVNVMITNTMSGQVPANLERLFDRFYRADSSRFYNTEGAGLGLSITRSIIHAHGGELSAEQQGREIVFKVRLLMD